MPTEALQVVETSASVFILFIAYEEGDIAGAVGHVYSATGKRDPGVVPPQVLDTNDTLRTLWASPGGALWVASADGNVATTAKVSWGAAPKGPRYKGMGSEPRWSVTALPKIKATGLPPNVTALWGTSDKDVYAGTYGGHIYRWNGTEWKQDFEGPGKGRGTIRAFGGAPKDVYAVGLQSTILHFDGTTWRPVRAPGPANGSEGLTGVVRGPDGDTMISGSGDEGRLIHGSASGGFEEFGRYSIDLIDMVPLGDRVLFATGNGVAELIGRDVQMIKSTFKTATASPGIGRVFFIEPAQKQPAYIEYNPAIESAPWWRLTF